MSCRTIYAFVVAVSLTCCVGCARTEVHKNPCANDTGLRFYRSKPYLKVAPEAGDTTKVAITLEYLPDFSEEYSVEAHTGIGSNDTQITLNASGVLTGLNVNTTSGVSDLITSVGGLIGNLPKPTSGGVPNESANATSTMVVPAYRVPLGYYEAVVSTGPDCKKHLYGWRYVAFAPFNKCPTEGSGLAYFNCECESLYGLVIKDGVLVFERIDDIAGDPVVITTSEAPEPSEAADKLKASVEQAIKNKGGLVPASGIQVDIVGKNVTFSTKGSESVNLASDKIDEILTKVVRDWNPAFQADNNITSM